MSNVIDMREYREVDPILRKGDLVRIVDDEAEIDGLTGSVIEILEILGPDSEAPGQASWMTVALPDEEGWVEYDLSLGSIVRILGEEADVLRGYQHGSV